MCRGDTPRSCIVLEQAEYSDSALRLAELPCGLRRTLLARRWVRPGSMSWRVAEEASRRPLHVRLLRGGAALRPFPRDGPPGRLAHGARFSCESAPESHAIQLKIERMLAW